MSNFLKWCVGVGTGGVNLVLFSVSFSIAAFLALIKDDRGAGAFTRLF